MKLFSYGVKPKPGNILTAIEVINENFRTCLNMTDTFNLEFFFFKVHYDPGIWNKAVIVQGAIAQHNAGRALGLGPEKVIIV